MVAGSSSAPLDEHKVMRTRIAPTPSGFLHVGNAANALATAWWAASMGGSIHLRIDDLDSDRVRPEYVDDILGLLRWLDIDWETGPRSHQDTLQDRGDRVARCRTHLHTAIDTGLPAYACRCSRRQITGIPTGGCPGGCRDLRLPLVPHETALRLAVDAGTVVGIEGAFVDVAEVLGDFVIWRRDDLPAYQWASVLEDDQHAITHILRGRDLIDSTAAQVHLAALLGLPSAQHVEVRHHDLVLDESGRKLSKSQSGSSQGLPRTPATRRLIVDTASQIARAHDIPRP